MGGNSGISDMEVVLYGGQSLKIICEICNKLDITRCSIYPSIFIRNISVLAQYTAVIP
jgi:hypothetical protein